MKMNPDDDVNRRALLAQMGGQKYQAPQNDMGGGGAAPPPPQGGPQPINAPGAMGQIAQKVANQANAVQAGGQQAVPRDPYAPPKGGIAGGMEPQPYDPGGVVGAPPATPPAPQLDKTGWKTNEFAAPEYIAQKAGGVMSGWDAGKWDDPMHQTPKYAVGRILSQYDPTVEGLGQAIGEIQKAYPGSTFNGKDKVTIPGVGTIDVLRGASVGGQGWQWDDGSGGGAQANPAMGGAPGGPGGFDALGGSLVNTNPDFFQQLMQQLGGATGQQLGAGALDRDALMRLMQ